MPTVDCYQCKKVYIMCGGCMYNSTRALYTVCAIIYKTGNGKRKRNKNKNKAKLGLNLGLLSWH